MICSKIDPPTFLLGREGKVPEVVSVSSSSCSVLLPQRTLSQRGLLKGGKPGSLMVSSKLDSNVEGTQRRPARVTSSALEH